MVRALSPYFGRAAWVLSATVSACGGISTTFTPLNPPPHGRRPIGSHGPDMYMSTAPNRPFTEIGLIEVQQETAYSSDDTADLVREVKETATRYGCEGLIIVGRNDRFVAGSFINTRPGGPQIGGMYLASLKGYAAVCILYND